MTLSAARTDRSAPVTLSRRGLLRLGLGAGALFALAACSDAGAGSVGGGGPGTVTWAWQLPTTWDPVTSSAGSDVTMLALAYDALTALDGDGNAVGWLAESWAYNHDGTRVTFTLRPGLKFSDGSPLDAVAVAKSIERGRSAPGSLIAPQIADLKSVAAQGDRDVVIDLKGTNYQYPLLLAGKTGMVVNPAVFEKDAHALATRPAGSGPFTVTSYVDNDHAELRKNDFFHLADQIRINRFLLYPAADPATVVASVASGQYDVAKIPASGIKAAQASGLEVQVLDSMYVAVLDVNTSKPPFDNPAVVEALKYGIDRAAIRKIANFGIGDVDYQPFPKGYVGYNAALADAFAYDPARARKILADAGLSGGVRSTLSASAPIPAAVEQIQAQLAEIGIHLTIDPVPTSQWTQIVYLNRAKPLGYDGFAGRESPLQAFQVLFSSTGLMNPARSGDPDLVAQIAKVAATPTDSPSYPAALQEATRLAVTRFPNTFLYEVPSILVRRPSLAPLRRHPSLLRWEGVSA
ncbi:putative ABC transporter, substrate-binding protein [Nocardia nova SH22a]|uniref:Putative ABC transporter, substrate-binding protein n=1 Tax=Nocardia nova SH22a TaxID=1415166 RepID=W5TRD0_9NOCA|nr:ABC transporter substrate-binding protein [Nocardia nova]AHH21483.1 putative ABC transporter, substrate-binding protein [Nocardia nova SH22a]